MLLFLFCFVKCLSTEEHDVSGRRSVHDEHRSRRNQQGGSADSLGLQFPNRVPGRVRGSARILRGRVPSKQHDGGPDLYLRQRPVQVLHNFLQTLYNYAFDESII